ncbi:MAG: hypothetical protein HS100_04495 [Anaerolineales bacterium]|nr:hypothetical protein [Anaerolineales bacterium]
MLAKFLIVCGGSGEYLLGQRRIAGIRGELQVDVSGEIARTTDRIKRGANDPNSRTVAADAGGASVKQHLNLIDEIAKQRGWNQKAKDHAHFVSDYFVEELPLVDGMAQSPAIGGLAISHPDVHSQLIGAIEGLLQGVANGSELEFWIVASTSGGTGAGIHRLVAEAINEVVQDQPFGSLKIKFIIIGPSTYKTIAGDRSAVSTFLGLAADAVLVDELTRKFPIKPASIFWYYIDVPDYGSGDPSRKPRGEIIATISRALMLQELVRDLDAAKVNVNTVLFRAGYWGKEYDEDVRYKAALDGFTTKIDQFIRPASDPFSDPFTRPGMEPKFKVNSGLQSVLDSVGKTDYLVERIEAMKGISRQSMPKQFGDLDNYLQSCEREVADFLDRQNIDYKKLSPTPPPPKYEFTPLAKGSEPNVEEPITFESQTETGNIGTPQWFKDVEVSQSVDAWVKRLLGVRRLVEDQKRKSRVEWYTPDGLLTKLFAANDLCAKAFRLSNFKNTDVIAGALVKSIGEYITLLVQVRILYDQYQRARQLLNNEMARLDAVRKYADHELGKYSSANTDGAPIVVANLDDILDRVRTVSWLELAYEQFEAKDTRGFKNVILDGVVGLTEKGLQAVLGLGARATTNLIQTELMQCGNMRDPNGNPLQALYFSGRDPINEAKAALFYRLLPKLELGYKLDEPSGSIISYKFPPVGVLGLRILALEGVAIAKPRDLITTHAWLIKPFAAIVKEKLKDASWKNPARGDDSSRLEIATLAVIGDPLSSEVLKAAGLNTDEIKELSELLYVRTFSKDIMKQAAAVTPPRTKSRP